MKTIQQYLAQLPEPYKTKARNNYDPSWNQGKVFVKSMCDALDKAFNWDASPEGSEYWLALHDNFLMQ